MTAAEVAKRLQVTEATVYRWAREGTLHATRLGRTLRFSSLDIEHLLEKREGSSKAADGNGEHSLNEAAAIFAGALVAEIVAQLRETRGE